MKTLTAVKLDKEWVVKIEDVLTASDETDVRKIVRENGLIINPNFCERTDDSKQMLCKIYAD
jgi:hypothetical protein